MKLNRSTFALAPLALAAALCGGVCAAPPDVAPSKQANRLPDFAGNEPQTRVYDGVSDDLLTGGMGKSGLAGAPPAYANPAAPTRAELRRAAIYNNYRALVDTSAAGGYGRLFGPNIDAAGRDALGEGKVAGSEAVLYVDGATLMVQIPDSFDPSRPCIVTASSSGSRGVYGAIGTSGEWGLKHGCAVAYTDKGTGNGLHDLGSDSATQVDGSVRAASQANGAPLFRSHMEESERADFAKTHPGRVAFNTPMRGTTMRRSGGATRCARSSWRFGRSTSSMDAPRTEVRRAGESGSRQKTRSSSPPRSPTAGNPPWPRRSRTRRGSSAGSP